MKHSILLLIALCWLSFTFGQKTKEKTTEISTPFVLGVIDKIQSTVLNETRILNIYLPEGYNPSDSIKYPVIYLLDGSADEDFIHIVGLVQFNTFEWVNKVSKSIVVGIANVDRARDFTYPSTLDELNERFPTAGHADSFISFIENELQPYLAKKYRTNQEKTLIGQSFGGLLATQILLKNPTLFTKYIIVSPSLWWDNGSLLNLPSTLYAEGYDQQTAIYIGVGKEGLTPTKVPRVMEVDANLLSDKIKQSKSKNVRVFFDYLAEENHATILHQAVSNAFEILYQPLEK